MKVLTQYLDHLLHPTRVALWLVLGLSSLSQPGFAQNKEPLLHRSTRSETDSAHGYWQLKTLAKTRTTLVQFFAPNQELIYQESLPEKWVKPTRRNRRQFDRLLKELLANQLVTTRIKTETLPTLLPEPRLPLRKLGADMGQKASGEETPYVVDAFVNKFGRLKLAIDSPLRLRYRIELTDERGRTYYEEYNNNPSYRRWLDISGLGTGQYSLVVHIDKQEVRYELNNGRATRLYQLEPLALNQR